MAEGLAVADWDVLLLGGTTASGKSTTASQIAARLGIGCVSGDSVWRAVLAMTTPETHPVLHEWPRLEAHPGNPGDLARLHIREAEMLAPAMEAFIDKECHESNRFVFHAAWIKPDFAARKCTASERIRAVFIDEPDAGNIMQAVLSRSGRKEPDHRQITMVEVARLYGIWLRGGAERLGLPIVAARPYETLDERVLAAADQPATITAQGRTS